MELKDALTLGLGLIGWGWAVTQFILTRMNHKLDKRFDVYSTFMNKMDEINQNMRNDPNLAFGISNSFIEKINGNDEEEINKAIIEFNSQLLEYTKKSIQPSMILNQEMNKLKLVCSEKLLPKINDYKQLVQDFIDEVQIVLNELSSVKDRIIDAKKLENIGHSERAKRLEILWKEIERMMRDEIGYYKK